MSWARFDDGIAFHPKVLRAGNEAFGAWVRMVTHSCQALTDGFVSDDVLKSITRPNVVKKLLEVGLLEAAKGGVQVHDFLDWNPPATEVRARRDAERARKAAGRSNQFRDPKSGQIAKAPDSRESPRDSQNVRSDNHADVRQDVRPDVRPESARTSAGPVPSRPVPSKREAEAPSPGAVGILGELHRGEDLFGVEADFDAAARRLDATLAGDPDPRVHRIDRRQIGVELVARARKQKGKHPHASPEQVFSELDTILIWILQDVRAGKWSAPAAPSSKLELGTNGVPRAARKAVVY